MQKRAFVLLSGGVDSTTCLFQAIYDYAPETIPIYKDPTIVAEIIGGMVDGTKPASETNRIDWVEAISVDYGQRHRKEFTYAAKTCEMLGIDHKVLNIKGILDGSGVMLTDASVSVPDISYGDIKGVSPTYVPFRNGTLLSLITAHAQKYVNAQIKDFFDNEWAKAEATMGDHEDMEQALRQHATEQAKDLCGIYFGAHNEDAFNWAYPDCTPEFIGSMANAIYTGSYYAIRLHTPLQWLAKSDVVRLGNRLDVPYENTWSCYKGEELQCGSCPTCRARKDAFRIARIPDPTEYAS